MPLTKATNKHLLPLYDRPMIFHSIETLKDYGCTDIIIVTGGEHIGHIAETVGDGEDLGVSVSYRVQKNADGIAGALKCVDGYIGGLFPVVLGDNYFSTTPPVVDMPSIYTKSMYNADQFGVYYEDTNQIVEKPEGQYYGDIVLGFYVYDDAVFEYVKLLEKSARGEFEVTDINNLYLTYQGMKVEKYLGDWLDMGSFDGLLLANIKANRGKYEIRI
jgi:glucose-1-phosphate thymidylyltransferase